MVAEKEPYQISQAREHLAKFEKDMMSPEGLYHLSEGLSLLDEPADPESPSSHSELAQNIGNSYVSKACSVIDARLESQSSTTEPYLEKYFGVLTEIGCFDFGNKEEVRKLKIKTFKLLFDEYLQGYSVEEKKKLIRDLQDGNT